MKREGAMIGIDLSGKTALVCGAGGGGLGTAVSLALAQAGADLVAVDQSEELVAEIRAEVLGLGVACQTIVANLMNPEEAATLVSKALAKVDRIDIVANIAGGTRFHQWSPIEETTEEVFRDVLALNLDYVFRVCVDAGRHMIAAGHPGSIISLTSISGLRSAPFHGPYGMAKRGVMAMSETMAIEWARYGIRVNTIAPGGVATPRIAKLSENGTRDREDVPKDGLRRVLPSEIAVTVAFLASDLASGISGQTLVIDSGMAAKNPAGGVKEYGAVMDAAVEQAKAGVVR
jgi:NAD(P)-dependent dehydrogenase (short-subunit alcohol dehydrogenase family)